MITDIMINQTEPETEIVTYNRMLRSELKKYFITYRVPEDFRPDEYFGVYWSKIMLKNLEELEDLGLTRDMTALSFIGQFSHNFKNCDVFFKGQLFKI